MPKKRANRTGGLFQYKNPDGTLKSRMFYGQYYAPDGRQVRKSTGEIVKQRAEAVLRKWMVDSERGLKPSPETQHLRYENLRNALIESYKIKGNKSLQTTADGEETVFPLPPLDAYFKGMKVSAITSDTVKDFIRKRQRDGVGNAAINNSLSLLRRMFSLARHENKLQATPHIEMLKPPPARKGFIEPADFSKLLTKLPKHLRPLITLLFFCGVRKGEAIQIEWPSVDLDKALIRLEEETTKTGEPRIIPIPDVLVKMLTTLRKKSGRVFDDRNLRKEWDKAKVSAGFPKLRVHDLRRSAIRNMMQAGAQQTEAMKISGHSTVSVFQRYNITSIEQIQKVMTRVEKLVPMPPKALPGRPNGESLVRGGAKAVRK